MSVIPLTLWDATQKMNDTTIFDSYKTFGEAHSAIKPALIDPLLDAIRLQPYINGTKVVEGPDSIYNINMALRFKNAHPTSERLQKEYDTMISRRDTINNGIKDMVYTVKNKVDGQQYSWRISEAQRNCGNILSSIFKAASHGKNSEYVTNILDMYGNENRELLMLLDCIQNIWEIRKKVSSLINVVKYLVGGISRREIKPEYGYDTEYNYYIPEHYVNIYGLLSFTYNHINPSSTGTVFPGSYSGPGSSRHSVFYLTTERLTRANEVLVDINNLVDPIRGSTDTSSTAIFAAVNRVNTCGHDTSKVPESKWLRSLPQSQCGRFDYSVVTPYVKYI